jgi:hypothetical protein
MTMVVAPFASLLKKIFVLALLVGSGVVQSLCRRAGKRTETVLRHAKVPSFSSVRVRGVGAARSLLLTGGGDGGVGVGSGGGDSGDGGSGGGGAGPSTSLQSSMGKTIGAVAAAGYLTSWVLLIGVIFVQATKVWADMLSCIKELKDEIKVLEMELTKAPAGSVARLMEDKKWKEDSLQSWVLMRTFVYILLLNLGSRLVLACVLASQRAND